MKQILIATSDRQAGGIERALRDQLALLEELDNVTLTILAPDTPFLHWAKSRGHQVKILSDFNRLAARHLPAAARLFGAGTSFDICLCHNGFLAPALARYSQRLVGICHNDKPKQFKGADELICLTPKAMVKAQRFDWHESALTLMPHYHEMPATRPSIKINQPLVIGAAGRMVAKKNLSLFIDIAADVKKTHPQITFELAGTGETEAALHKHNESCGHPVEMKGWTDFATFLERLDIFIIPSLDEPFGYVFLEAMSAGKAILATPTNGADFCLDGGNVAPVIAPDKPDDFAAEIHKFAADSKALMAAKQACLARAADPIFAKETALKRWRAFI